MEDIGTFLQVNIEESGDAIHEKKDVTDKPAKSQLMRLAKVPKAYGKKGKTYDSQSREIIANVFHFMKKEGMNPYPSIPLKNFAQRAEAATKVAVSTVHKIYREFLAVQSGDKPNFTTPGTVRARPSRKTQLYVGTIEEIRNIVHTYYRIEKDSPPLEDILKRVRESDIGFEGGHTSLRTVLLSAGFIWQKTNERGRLLIESYDIRLKRTKYLRAISKFRADGRSIVYADEAYLQSTPGGKERTIKSVPGVKTPICKGKRLTVVHAGSEDGFIPNGLLMFSSGSKSASYHDDMNPENFINWVRTQLIPNLPPNSVLVIKNASYHNVHLNDQPTTATNRKDMVKWLTANNILFNEHLTRPELYELIKNSKSARTEFKLDVLLQQHGHDVLRLPPHHPELNPIERIWVLMKNWAAARNVKFELSNAEDLVRRKFNEITADEWLSMSNRTKQIEKDYLKNEIYLDEVLDGFKFLSEDDNAYSSGEENGDE